MHTDVLSHAPPHLSRKSGFRPERRGRAVLSISSVRAGPGRNAGESTSRLHGSFLKPETQGLIVILGEEVFHR